MIEMSQLARTAIFHIIEEEGGFVYTDHPSDRDKGTYAGVRYKVFAEYYKINISDTAEMTPLIYKEMAGRGVLKDIIIDIYYINYYQKLNIDKLPDVLKMPVFSCGVNTGTRRAGIILQRTVNEILHHRLGVQGGSVANFLKVDGIIGSKTIVVIEDMMYNHIIFEHNLATPLDVEVRTRALINLDKLRNTFIKNWFGRYFNVIHDVPNLSTFVNGCFNRANKYWVL